MKPYFLKKLSAGFILASSNNRNSRMRNSMKCAILSPCWMLNNLLSGNLSPGVKSRIAMKTVHKTDL